MVISLKSVVVVVSSSLSNNMKFLPPLVCCFNPTVPQQEVPTSSLHTQEARPLMPLSSSVENDHSPPRNKASCTQWKPSLSAISEDKAVKVLAAERNGRSCGETAGKSKSKAKTVSYNNSHHHYRRPTPTVFQTVAPVAFIF